jgi:hypothetical protein
MRLSDGAKAGIAIAAANCSNATAGAIRAGKADSASDG